MALRKKKAAATETLPAAQPGTVVSPGSNAVRPTGLPRQAEDRFVASTTMKSAAAQPQKNHQAASGGLFQDNESEQVPAEAQPETAIDDAPAPATTDGPDGISWTASEFVAHEKSATWYLALAGSAAVIAALIYLLTRDKISTAVVIVGALTLGFYGARQPRQLDYRLNAEGVNIGQKYYRLEDFRSFAVVPEGAFASVIFMPLKRFAPLVTIYYAPTDEDKIVKLLSDSLPLEPHRADAVDNFMRRIRF